MKIHILKRVIKIKIIAVCLCCHLFLPAQDIAKDVLKLNEKYKEIDSISMKMQFILYKDYTSSVAFETVNGILMKQNKNLYNSIATVESLTNSKYSLFIDNDSHIIIIGNVVKTDSTNNKKSKFNIDLNFSVESMSALVASGFTIEEPPKFYFLKNSSDSIRALKVDLNYSDYESIECYYYPKTYIIKKIILYYRDAYEIDENGDTTKPRLEINYSNVDEKTMFNQDIFSEKKYVSISDKTVTGIGKYSKYKIVNNITK